MMEPTLSLVLIMSAEVKKLFSFGVLSAVYVYVGLESVGRSGT